MPSGWNIYQVVILSSVLALGIPLALGLFSRAILPRARIGRRAPVEPRPALVDPVHADARTQLGRRMNTRFFAGANSAVILLTLGLALIPCASALKGTHDPGKRVRVLVGTLTLATLAALGLFYSARKGDLDWLRTFRDEDPK